MYATGHDVQLVSRLNPVLDGVRGETGFVYNKDEAMMVCPAGHLAYKERYLKHYLILKKNPGVMENPVVFLSRVFFKRKKSFKKRKTFSVAS